MNPLRAILNLPGWLISVKGKLSAFKIKWEASSYGIPPEQIDQKEAGLHKAYTSISEGKRNEAALKYREASIRRVDAEAHNIDASTAARYAKVKRGLL